VVKYVLDACAVIALLNGESGAENVAGLYEKADNNEAELIMSKVNLLEVYYGYLKVDGETFAERQLTLIGSSRIRVIDVISDDIMRQVGKIKNIHRKISLADAFAVSQAILLDGILVTSDHHELDVVDQAGTAKFLWIR
jgi:predicted nucleic acid-binding protein